MKIAMFTLKSASTKGGGGQRYNEILSQSLKNYQVKRYYQFGSEQHDDKGIKNVKIGKYSKWNIRKNIKITKNIKQMYNDNDLVIMSTAFPISLTKEQKNKTIWVQHSDTKKGNKLFYSYISLLRVFYKIVNNKEIPFYWDVYHKVFNKNVFFSKECDPLHRSGQAYIPIGVTKLKDMNHNSKKEYDVVFVGRVDDKAKRVSEILIPLSKKYKIALYGPVDKKFDFGNAEYLGFTKSPSFAISKARVNVLPSKREGYGMSIPEASSTGVPSVYIDGWSTAKFLSANNENIMLPVNASIDDFDKAIERAIHLKNSNELIQFSIENHSIEAFEKKWKEVIDEAR